MCDNVLGQNYGFCRVNFDNSRAVTRSFSGTNELNCGFGADLESVCEAAPFASFCACLHASKSCMYPIAPAIMGETPTLKNPPMTSATTVAETSPTVSHFSVWSEPPSGNLSRTGTSLMPPEPKRTSRRPPPRPRLRRGLRGYRWLAVFWTCQCPRVLEREVDCSVSGIKVPFVARPSIVRAAFQSA